MRFPFLPALSLSLLIASLFGVWTPRAAHAATFTVTKTADTNDGACDADCSLREAIAAASAASGDQTIAFASPLFDTDQTIALTSGELNIQSSDNLTLNGPTQAILTLDAAHQSRVFNVGSAKVAINHLVLANGTSESGQGGCILNGGTLSLTGCVVMGGNAQSGGGIYNNRGFLYLTNCTVIRNTVSTGACQGGGVANWLGVAYLVNCTLTDNTANNGQSGGMAYGQGGGVWSETYSEDYGTLWMLNTIVAGNNSPPYSSKNVPQSSGGPGGPDLHPGSSFSFGQYNLIGQVDASSGQFFNESIVNTDARFELDPQTGRPALKDNGGGTLTVALLPDSPALNRGYTDPDTTTDQRGFPRPHGTGLDIGAYEEQHLTPLLKGVTISPAATTLTPITGDTLTASVEIINNEDSAEVFRTAWTWTRTRSGEVVTLPENSDTLHTSSDTVQRGDLITVTATVQSDQRSFDPVSASVTIQPAPPIISRLQLAPGSPRTRDIITAYLTVRNPEGGALTYYYSWQRNGAIIKNSRTSSSQGTLNLSTPNFGDKGDVITLTVNVANPRRGAIATATLTVANTPPRLEKASLTPDAPTPGHRIRASYRGSDDDKDPLTAVYKWHIGARTLPNEHGAVIDLAAYPKVKAGDVVMVEVRLTDGIGLSGIARASVTVAAPAPSPTPAPSAASASSPSAPVS